MCVNICTYLILYICYIYIKNGRMFINECFRKSTSPPCLLPPHPTPPPPTPQTTPNKQPTTQINPKPPSPPPPTPQTTNYPHQPPKPNQFLQDVVQRLRRAHSGELHLVYDHCRSHAALGASRPAPFFLLGIEWNVCCRVYVCVVYLAGGGESRCSHARPFSLPPSLPPCIFQKPQTPTHP